LDRIDEYLELSRERPELFVTPPGGIRILLDRSEIEAVERNTSARLAASGLDPAGARVGVLLRDPWFMFIRDAVEFPDGARRTHARTVNRVGDGVAALPLYEGRILLLRHFRHATRRWMLEIPRGGIEPGDSPESTAENELLEEMQAHATRIERLGFVYGSANLYRNGAHLFFAEVADYGAPQIGEGITAIEPVTVETFEDLVRRGEIVDSFTVAAFLHARLRSLV